MTDLVSTPDELDTLILEALTACGGGPVEWSAVRAQLPRSRRYWRPIEALCRLRAAGRLDAVKLGGATIVASSIAA